MRSFDFLNTTIMISGESPEDTVSSETVTGTEEPSGEIQPMTGFGGSNFIMIAYIIGLVVLFYFFAIRPQKKREKEHKETLASIKVGDSIMTTGGFYGKVVDSYDDIFAVELGMNKTIVIAIKKSEVVTKAEPNLTTSSKDDV